LDFETTNFYKGDPTYPDNHIVLACWTYQGNRYSHWGDERHQGLLLSHIEQADFFVAHNSKFELGWLKRMGADLHKVLPYCTMIGEYTLAGNRKVDLSLDGTLKRRRIGSKHSLGQALVHGGVDPREVPESVLEEYCMQDVEDTDKIFRVQWPEIVRNGLERVLFTRNMFTPCLADIEFNGMLLDKERTEIEYRKTYEELNKVTVELNGITGGINPNSTKQMAEFIYDTLGFAELTDRKGNPIRTGAGKRSVSEETLGKLQARNRQQRDFLRLKATQGKLQSRVSKYLEKFKQCCEENDGLLLFNFNQTITQTGRLSSNGKIYKTQGQNLDRTLKPLFTAPEGYLCEERDYKQLEFRVAGELTGDEQVMADVLNGADVHAYTASVLTSSGQETTRQDAKSRTFKPLYGGESGTRAEKSYYEAFKRKYSRVTECQTEWVSEALKSKCLRMKTGLIFYFPDLSYSKSGYIHGSTQVKNYPVQYFATGEIVPIGVMSLWRSMKTLQLRSYIDNTIHDSIKTSTWPEEKELVDKLAVESLTQEVKRYMLNVYNIELKYPLEIDVTSGTHWGK